VVASRRGSVHLPRRRRMLVRRVVLAAGWADSVGCRPDPVGSDSPALAARGAISGWTGSHLRRRRSPTSRSNAGEPREGRASRRARRGSGRGALGVSSPRWVQAIGLLSLVSAFVSRAISPGSPSEIDGQYYVVNKSAVESITRSAYLVASGWQAGAFLSIGAYFTVLVLFYLQDDRPPLPRSMRVAPPTPRG
jgi:hypothetical protein